MPCSVWSLNSYYGTWLWLIHDEWPTAFELLAIGMVVAFVVIPTVIYLQRKASLGQRVYESGPAAHLSKQGTPTMGGIAFSLSAISAAVFLELTGRALWILQDGNHWIINGDDIRPFLVAGIVAVVALIGFIDDILIIRQQRALGLRARTKIVLLIVVSSAAAYALLNLDLNAECGGWTPRGIEQWWFGQSIYLPNAWYYVLAVAAIVGSANAVNLTDGVDGLAGAVALPPLLILSVIAGGWVGLAVAGSLVVFLFFNRHPAKVFMGDTGSLALGALLAALAIDAHLLLFLPLLGIVFVVEALSVIAQVISFKLTGKRIFKMSPLHHHFELSGWSEQRVTRTFAMVSLLASVIFCAIVYFSNVRVPGL